MRHRQGDGPGICGAAGEKQVPRLRRENAAALGMTKCFS